LPLFTTCPSSPGWTTREALKALTPLSSRADGLGCQRAQGSTISPDPTRRFGVGAAGLAGAAGAIRGAATAGLRAGGWTLGAAGIVDGVLLGINGRSAGATVELGAALGAKAAADGAPA
jgi:hypothetical protein